MEGHFPKVMYKALSKDSYESILVHTQDEMDKCGPEWKETPLFLEPEVKEAKPIMKRITLPKDLPTMDAK